MKQNVMVGCDFEKVNIKGVREELVYGKNFEIYEFSLDGRAYAVDADNKDVDWNYTIPQIAQACIDMTKINFIESGFISADVDKLSKSDIEQLKKCILARTEMVGTQEKCGSVKFQFNIQLYVPTAKKKK
jgi:hypothetical protein